MTVRPRALVADDDVAIRVLVTRILTRNGFEVDSVADGAAAIEHILERHYAVVFLDLMMPRVDGFKVIEYFNTHDVEVLKRVIVMTAFGATGVEKVHPFVHCCVEKPFEVNDLVRRAKALLPRESPAPRAEPPRPAAEAKEASSANVPASSDAVQLPLPRPE